jgi:sugar phosphate isomerase/epimerase
MEFIEWPLSVDFDEEEAWSLVRECLDQGLTVDLHPYLSGVYDTANFEETEENACAQLIRRYLAFARRVGEAQGHPCVVNLHPPCSLFAVADLPKSHVRRILVLRSLYFHRWVEGVLRSEGPRVVLTAEVQLAAEREDDFVRLGDHYRELLYCLSGIEGIGACWDMGHSTVNHARFNTERYPLDPPGDFVPRVRHVHLHDVHGREDHHPLSGGATPYREHLARLRRAGFDGDVNLELPLARILERGTYREVMADNVRKVREAWEAAL